MLHWIHPRLHHIEILLKVVSLVEIATFTNDPYFPGFCGFKGRRLDRVLVMGCRQPPFGSTTTDVMQQRIHPGRARVCVCVQIEPAVEHRRWISSLMTSVHEVVRQQIGTRVAHIGICKRVEDGVEQPTLSNFTRCLGQSKGTSFQGLRNPSDRRGDAP